MDVHVRVLVITTCNASNWQISAYFGAYLKFISGTAT